jgi:hypothetical protein
VEKDARSQRKKVANDLLVNYVAKKGKKVTTHRAHKQNAITKTHIIKKLDSKLVSMGLNLVTCFRVMQISCKMI